MQPCDALHDLVLFAQFKKSAKHPWKSVTFSKVAGFSLDSFRYKKIDKKTYNLYLICSPQINHWFLFEEWIEIYISHEGE